jgi:hypothetical protein
MRIKYIMQEDNTPILFSELQNHSDVALLLGRKIVGAAGFCHLGNRDEFNNPVFTCYGESSNLRIKSRGQQDSDIINRVFGLVET